MADEPVTWNAFRSQSREVGMNVQMKPWMIRTLRLTKLIVHFQFLFYIVGHILVIAGAAASKLWVTLLATNVKQKQLKIGIKHYKACTRKKASFCSGSINNAYQPFYGGSFSGADERDFAAVLLFCLWLIQLIPELFAGLQALWRLNSKKSGKISFLVIAVECSRTIGNSLLFFIVFPELDILRCILLSVFAAYIPFYQAASNRIRRAFYPVNTYVLREDYVYYGFSSLARRSSFLMSSSRWTMLLLIVLSSSYLWPVMGARLRYTFVIPFALLFSAIGFWDAWVQPYHAASAFHILYEVSAGQLRALLCCHRCLKYGFRKLTASTRCLVSLCRFVLSTLILSLSPHMKWSRCWKQILSEKSDEDIDESSFTSSSITLAFAVIVINFFLRTSSRLLAATNMRIASSLHPLFIVPPILVAFSYFNSYVTPFCGLPFISSSKKEIGLLWQSFSRNWPGTPFSDILVTWAWVIAYLFWARRHVKSPEFEENSEIIDSMTPVVNGLFIEQSLVVYRHSINNKVVDLDVEENEEKYEGGGKDVTDDDVDKTITLYACATMWHETRNEMKQMVMSIMRVDKERSLIMAGKSIGRLKFRFEAHIFFDDAWEDQEECGRVPNEYFKTLFNLLIELTSCENNDSKYVNARVLVNTPYGGRFVIRLPEGTLLYVHLKDKKLIRNKKRWSQVMYMYYLLGHRIMDSPRSVEDRQLDADNTYILAIDGDSKFQPSSVLKLLQLLDSKKDIGCACGRIHPLGNGMMVWYQKFEYAIAHWLQKAAEHAYGCVLCAPGCFSMFRASALMDDNVMHKYTKKPSEPRHFLQYDQGEDRWLSTLLLKQGYRIEYEAAADAETYAPEGFNEFYNQRRRWTPSSVANTIDLLADYKRACANNNSISKLYIAYQSIVTGCACFGPGIMFTMIVYSMSAVFQVHSDTVLKYNAIPLLLYIVVCFVGEPKHQLALAKILSVVYAFIMVAVSVATACETALQTIFAPTAFFALVMSAMFIGAAAMHPQEFYNIIYGFPFFLMIPCTFLFMALYSLINLHVMNWGTRESAKKKEEEEKSGGSILRRLSRRFSKKNLLRSLSALKGRKFLAPNISDLERRINELERVVEDVDEKPQEKFATPAAKLKILTTPETNGSTSTASTISSSARNVRRVTENRFMWMEQEYLQICTRGRLSPSEQSFWNELIDNYLKPHVMSPEESKRAADGLIGMRNQIATLVLMINGLFVLTIYLVQKHKDILKGFSYKKWDEKKGKGYIEVYGGLNLEPVGLVILTILMGILLVQIIGMFIHRLNTVIGAMNEISFLEDYGNYEGNDYDEMKILDNARQMVDTVYYINVHGPGGYVRAAKESAVTSVVYKLQRSRLAKRMEKPSIPTRVGFD
uniref:chitin synthase n=1 Tax=Enterobius vermicularis TaxID=51028 RepID=A0A0N4V0Q6_ENTVE